MQIVVAVALKECFTGVRAKVQAICHKFIYGKLVKRHNLSDNQRFYGRCQDMSCKRAKHALVKHFAKHNQFVEKRTRAPFTINLYLRCVHGIFARHTYAIS